MKSNSASPCLGCERRRLRCHGSCEDYKAFRAVLDEMSKAAYEERTRRSMIRRWKKVKGEWRKVR